MYQQRDARASLLVDVVARSGGARTVRVAGEVDLASSRFLRTALSATPSPGGDVTVDLAAVTFADTQLVHALTHLQAEQSRQGGRLDIVNVPPRVERLFAMAGFAWRPCDAIDESREPTAKAL